MTKDFSNQRGFLFALAGFTVWALSDASLKFIGGSTLPKYEIMVFMSVGALVTMAIVTFLRGKVGNLRPQRPGRLVILGVMLTTNLVTLFVAFKHLSLVSLYSITFLGPMLVAVLAAVFLGERILKIQILAILVGFYGVIISIDPFHSINTYGDLIGYAAAFVSLLLNTVNMLLLRVYGKDEHHESMAFYPRLVMFATGLLACVYWRCAPFDWEQLIVMLAAGVFAGIGWMFMNVACQRSPASIVAPYRYTQIVTGALLGYVIWRDVPTWHVIAGSAIIIASGLISAHHARRAEAVI